MLWLWQKLNFVDLNPAKNIAYVVIPRLRIEDIERVVRSANLDTSLFKLAAAINTTYDRENVRGVILGWAKTQNALLIARKPY